MLEKSKKYLSLAYNKINFIIEFIFSIILAHNLFKILYYSKYTDFTFKKSTAFFVISLIIILIIIIHNLIKNKNKLEKIFVSIVIPIGMLYLAFVMPNVVPDESSHIVRAYDVSKGNIISPISEDGDSKIQLPKHYTKADNDTYEKLYKLMHEETNYYDCEDKYTGAQSYMATIYVPSSIIFFIARKLSLNFFVAIFLARMLNFIIFIICGYYAIKLIPFGKLVMFVYMLTPMILQQAASISADSITNSFVLLFIGYSIYLFKNNEKLTTKKKILYYLICIVLGTAKYVYFPIVGISLIAIGSKNIEKKDKTKVIITSIVRSFIFSYCIIFNINKLC